MKDKSSGMPYFNKDHWEKKPGEVELSNGKYSEGNFSEGEHLKTSVNKLSSYVRKHKAQH